MIDTNVFILDTIFDTLPSGMILFESDGTILRMNRKAKEILGMDMDTTPPGMERFPFYLTPLVSHLKNATEDIHRAEIPLELPTREEESTIGYSLKRIPTPDGKLVNTLTFTDITLVLKDRLAMDKIKDELNQSKKLASIGTMVAGVAHELNNPLTGISMSTSLLKMNIERMKKQPLVLESPKLLDSMDKAIQEIYKISRASERAAVLVNDLLSYSKPSQLYLMPMSLNDLINEIVGALKSHPQFSQFTFKIEGQTDRTILCDRVRLEQVFYNLFKNACDATEGKGTLTISFSEYLEDGRTFVVAHVKDNGPGIDKTIISRIFDPFFTTKGNSGVGLGLSICYRTVEQHGGLLSVDSVKWEGTEFKIALPVYSEDERANKP
jgi:two-component system NtrC family sensor kinase